ncbi:hypothetical protein MMC22_005386 [Lobaria immixta]|nr:hypothetical protein [Lobaria immixta]
MRLRGVRYPESTYSPNKGRMNLIKHQSTHDPYLGPIENGSPARGKGQPVSNSPCDQNDSVRKPYTPRGFVVAFQTRCKVYGYEQYDTDGKRNCQKDGDQKICGSGMKREETA